VSATSSSIGPFGRRHSLVESGPATFQQEREFLLSIDRASIANMFMGVKATGPLDVTTVRRALEAIVARHAGLRTTLTTSRGGVLQQIHQPVPIRLDVVDLSGSVDDWGVVEERVAVAFGAPFDLSHLPALRCELLRFGPEEHLLVACIPHTSGDARSQEIFFREFALTYVGLATSRPFAPPHLPMQLRDVAAWQRSKVHTRALRYWQEHLASLTERDRCPLTSGIWRGAAAERECTMAAYDAATAAAYTEFSRRHSASPALLTTAGAALVARHHARGPRAVVNLVHASRSDPGTRDLIGCLCDAVPLVINLQAPVSFSALLRQLAATLRNAEAHILPWTIARDLLGGPVDIAINYVRYRGASSVVGDLRSGTVMLEEYLPLQRYLVQFPIQRHWLDFQLSFENVVQADKTMRNAVCYFPSAVDESYAVGLHRELSNYLARGLAEPCAPLWQ
jgi:Condensation domain